MGKQVTKALESSATQVERGRKQTASFADEVRALRSSLDLSQEAFSKRFNIPLANLRNWEQPGRGVVPDSAGRLLIAMIHADPKGVEELVRKAAELERDRK